MKTKLLGKDGKAGKEIELPKCFSSKVREDIAQKYFEVMKKIQPYASYEKAGMEYSASGIISHRRNKWKTAYGKGISRVPRKILWRRGTQFYWVGATVAGTVGGRKAHSPKIGRFSIKRKINVKERLIAINSALSATAKPDYLIKKYSRINEIKDLPLIVDGKIIELKTKQFLEVIEKILGNNYEVALKEKRKRAGRGKTRGRKYRKTAGLLFMIGSKEEFKCSRIEVRKINELEIKDLFPLGRLTIYTEKAIQDLTKLMEAEK